jgi:hypothetical protein
VLLFEQLNGQLGQPRKAMNMFCPGTSGFGGDSDAVQGQVSGQLIQASRDSFAAMRGDGFVVTLQ